MEVGIGLPATIPEVTRDGLLEWARRADSAGFSALGTIDRLVYGNHEPLMALAAAAAVTERIKLMTDILLVPWRANAALIAKQALTLQNISGGRLVLGVGAGGREDDYAASGVPFDHRGERYEEMLKQIGSVWAADSGIGPAPPQGPPELLIGGGMDAAFERAARLGSGWTMGGETPEMFAESLEKLRGAWSRAGREGRPRTVALAYFALGDDAAGHADRYLHDYYAWLDEAADAIVAGAAKDEDTVQDFVQAFADAGADEFILFPCNPDPGQVDLLASAVLPGVSVHPRRHDRG